jgi:hypothetical protein
MNTTFGIEIEFVNDGTYTQAQIASEIRSAGVDIRAEGYNHDTRPHWKLTTDATGGMGTNGQRTGFEIVSPILDPRNGDRCWNEIIIICNVLNRLGIKVNKSCGLHVHLDVSRLTPKKAASLAARYIRNEHFIDMAMPKSRRGNANYYCQSSTMHTINPAIDPVGYMTATNATLTQLRNVTRMTDIVRILNPYANRYRKINMVAFSRQGTMEFRQAAGTTNSKKIIMWVRFLLALYGEAERTSYVRSLTTIKLTSVQAQGTFWRMTDRAAGTWFLNRIRKFEREENPVRQLQSA